MVYKQRCIVWPLFLSHLALDLAEVTEVAGASYCSKEPFVSVQCSCTPLCHTATVALTVITDSLLTSTGSSKSADGRVTEAWTALYSTLTQMGKRGIHILAQLCSMLTGLYKSHLTLGGVLLTPNPPPGEGGITQVSLLDLAQQQHCPAAPTPSPQSQVYSRFK